MWTRKSLGGSSRGSTDRTLAKLGMVGVALWVLAPLIVAGSAAITVSRTEVFPASDTWVPLDSSKGSVQRPVGIQLSWSAATDLYAPAWHGVVQLVHIAAGEELVSGDVIAKIDGVDRLAYSSPLPFSRSLSRHDRGEDVRALNALLDSRDLDHANSDHYTWATDRGVRKLAEQLGVQPSKADAFDPGWVVYLPTRALEVSEVSLLVGAPAPPPGSVLVRSERSLSSAVLIAATDVPSTSTSTDEDEVDAEVKPTTTAATSERLVVGTATLELNEKRDAVDATTLSRLEGIIERLAPFARGVLERPIPSGHYRVPAGAVVTERSGKMCILRATERDGDGEVTGYEGVEVQVLSSEDGAVWLTGHLSASDLVNASPSTHMRSCT